jgi:molybdopterin-guanine dinucleotide biosynthesis protein MobB
MEQLHLVTIAGLKGSGKTTVVEAIVSELHVRGYRVGTVKTMRHHADPLNGPDTDTHRHGEAGASVVVAIHADGTSRFERSRPPGSLPELSGLFPRDIEVLVSEGVIDPSDPQMVVLCLKEPSALQETLATRRLSARFVVAVSGPAAASWDPALLPGIPSFDVTNAAQKKALVDMLLGKIREADKPR